MIESQEEYEITLKVIAKFRKELGLMKIYTDALQAQVRDLEDDLKNYRNSQQKDEQCNIS